VLSLLRAADALDNRNLRPPSISMTLKDRDLTIVSRVAKNCAKSRKVFSRRKKFRLLEELLDCRVELHSRNIAATSLPARHT
jgi:hypothetical protein